MDKCRGCAGSVHRSSGSRPLGPPFAQAPPHESSPAGRPPGAAAARAELGAGGRRAAARLRLAAARHPHGRARVRPTGHRLRPWPSRGRPAGEPRAAGAVGRAWPGDLRGPAGRPGRRDGHPRRRSADDLRAGRSRRSRVGDRVVRGSVLGRVSVGHAACRRLTCLHWGLLRGQVYLNPLSLINGGPMRLLPLTARGLPLSGEVRIRACCPLPRSLPPARRGPATDRRAARRDGRCDGRCGSRRRRTAGLDGSEAAGCTRTITSTGAACP